MRVPWSTLAWACRSIVRQWPVRTHMLTTSVRHDTRNDRRHYTQHDMKIVRLWRNVLCCLTLVVASSVGAEEPEANKSSLRVLTYNIHHGEGVDGELDLERIASVIKSVEPDIVSLQEVDQKAARTESIDQPAELSRLTRMQVVFGDNIKLQGGLYGNVVLSRLPIKRHENHPLPPFENGERRGLLEVELEGPKGSSLTFFATHLDHQRSAKDRIAAAEIIATRSKTLTNQPALLAGDLNDGPSSATLKQLESAGWIRSNKEPIATVPVKAPLRQIDFILYRPEKDWRVIETRVLDEKIASDHRAVLAAFELLPDGP